MMNKKLIDELESKLLEVQNKKIDCVRGQRYERACILRREENNLFAELEALTNSEYLKVKWKVINDNAGHYIKSNDGTL